MTTNLKNTETVIGQMKAGAQTWYMPWHKGLKEPVNVLTGRVFKGRNAAIFLQDDSPYSVQEPIVPRKVVREAIANAVMHRTYLKHSPIQIIRYSNRIEFRNIGHSIKPEDQLGRPGSWPRNPLLGAVLHALNLAEAKGSGIRTMRRLSADADLSPPEFKSDREGDSFCVTVFLHNLLSEDDHAWLRTLTSEPLDDEETKVLIYARATGAVDNSACRDFSGMDTLTASRVLRRLRDRGLLEKQGAGNRTYYSLRPVMQEVVEAAETNTHSDSAEAATLLATLPPELATQLDAKNQRSLIETASEFGFSLIFASPAPLTTARYCVPIVQREGMNLIGRSGWQVLEQLEA